MKDIKSSKFSVPDFPDSPEKGCHDVGFSDTIYIERADFKEKGEKGYRRLTMDQEVGLKHAGMVLKATKVVSPNEIDVEVIEREFFVCFEYVFRGFENLYFLHFSHDFRGLSDLSCF